MEKKDWKFKTHIFYHASTSISGLVLKSWFCLLKCGHTEKKGDGGRGSSCSYWFTPQMTVNSQGWVRWIQPKQESGTPSPWAFITWMSEAKHIGHLLLLYQAHLYGIRMEMKQPRLYLYGILASQVVGWNHCITTSSASYSLSSMCMKL